MGDGLVCLTDPGRQVSHVVTSMFLHGSWFHLLGNMWFLWLFGNNIEDSMGRARFMGDLRLPGVLAVVVLASFAVAFLSLVSDIVYAYLDPRVRYR